MTSPGPPLVHRGTPGAWKTRTGRTEVSSRVPTDLNWGGETPGGGEEDLGLLSETTRILSLPLGPGTGRKDLLTFCQCEAGGGEGGCTHRLSVPGSRPEETVGWVRIPTYPVGSSG